MDICWTLPHSSADVLRATGRAMLGAVAYLLECKFFLVKCCSLCPFSDAWIEGYFVGGTWIVVSAGKRPRHNRCILCTSRSRKIHNSRWSFQRQQILRDVSGFVHRDLCDHFAAVLTANLFFCCINNRRGWISTILLSFLHSFALRSGFIENKKYARRKWASSNVIWSLETNTSAYRTVFGQKESL